MKTLKIMTMLAMAALTMIGCRNEDLKIDSNEKGSTIGYLSLTGLSVECVADHKEVGEGVEDKGVQAATNVTRTVDINTFDCKITTADGSKTISEFKYGARPSERIELEAGDYLFIMSSGEIPGVAWESPVYGLTEKFTIIRKETTTLNDLVCTLQNIQVSVTFSADLRAALSDDTVTTITIGENSMPFGIDETRSAHFLAPKPLNDIEVLVKGSYTPEGKDTASPFEMTATIKDVKAGQYSDINFYIEYSGEGGISIGATIDGWVVDEEIIYDFSMLLSENVMPDDDDKPTIVWTDGDIKSPITIYPTDFDVSGNCTKNIVIDINAKNTISKLEVAMSSTNSEFLTSLAALNIPQTLDLCNAGTAATALTQMGYAVNDDVLGKESVSYNLTAQMKELGQLEGEHTFAVTITDASGLETKQNVVIIIANGPVVEWIGYDLSKRYSITDELTVELVVTAPAGIKEFTVFIDSEVLTPAQLKTVFLCNKLNLVNPEASIDTTDPENTDTSKIRESLINLGFPVGDQVLNQTRVEFSITQFLSLLKITGKGMHDFVLSVTDNEGKVTEKTLMLVTE